MSDLAGKWDQWLPKSYQWVSQLQVKVADGLVDEAWNLVPVIAKSDSNNEISLQGMDKAQIDAFQSALTSHGWSASDTTLRTLVGNTPVLFVNVSSVKASSIQVARQVGIDAARALSGLQNKAIALHTADELRVVDVFEGYVQAIEAANYFKGQSKGSSLPPSIWVSKDSLDAVKKQIPFAKALIFNKWMQDAPANFMNCERMAEIVEELFKDKAELTILGREQMRSLGMGSFLSVAEGSHRDPKLIAIKFKGKDSSRTVALVGKGVTFDSGGINIKPSGGMDEMKYDMSGAAAVLGAAQYFSEVTPDCDVVCAVGAVENMPSSRATRPGDVVKSLSGKTIEILNTDAEGRLVLADVLTYTMQQYKPQLVIDIATLTGAVLFGLGHTGAGFMTPDDNTADLLRQVGRSYGENLWQLPLWAELESEVKSELADLKNIAKANVKAGTIMGGWFLHEFVKDFDCQWAHVDIAGTAWSCNALGYLQSGGSAYGLRTLVGVCKDYQG